MLGSEPVPFFNGQLGGGRRWVDGRMVILPWGVSVNPGPTGRSGPVSGKLPANTTRMAICMFARIIVYCNNVIMVF